MSIEDQAQKYEFMDWERLNSRVGGQVTFEPHEEGFGPEECDECLGAMPLARRRYGFTVCISCKQIMEAKENQYARV